MVLSRSISGNSIYFRQCVCQSIEEVSFRNNHAKVYVIPPNNYKNILVVILIFKIFYKFFPIVNMLSNKDANIGITLS